MPEPSDHTDSYQVQLENLRSGVREIAHEINNPLGILRMATYFLESTKPNDEKKAHYFKVVNESLDRIEASLKRLKELREDPTKGLPDIPPESNL